MARILLVEDDEINRDMLTRRLQKRGFEVTTAVDGADACAQAEGNRPDLILMDMAMPIMDGYEATRRLKESPATRSIPIIGLTAYAMAGDRARVLAAGCEDYDVKPIDLTRLLGKMQALLNGDLTR